MRRDGELPQSMTLSLVLVLLLLDGVLLTTVNPYIDSSPVLSPLLLSVPPATVIVVVSLSTQPYIYKQINKK